MNFEIRIKKANTPKSDPPDRVIRYKNSTILDVLWDAATKVDLRGMRAVIVELDSKTVLARGDEKDGWEVLQVVKF